MLFNWFLLTKPGVSRSLLLLLLRTNYVQPTALLASSSVRELNLSLILTIAVQQHG
jgi:hypothetical protein